MSDPQPSETPPMPPLTLGDIDGATLQRYHQDLQQYAQVDLVRCKYYRHRYTKGGEQSLAEAFADLGSGQACGLQVSYRYDGEAWRDTVLQSDPGNFRIVRLREADLALPAPETVLTSGH